MSVKLLTEHHLEFLGLKGGYTGSTESTRVKIPHCWESHVTAHFVDSEDSDQRPHFVLNLFEIFFLYITGNFFKEFGGKS